MNAAQVQQFVLAIKNDSEFILEIQQVLQPSAKR